MDVDINDNVNSKPPNPCGHGSKITYLLGQTLLLFLSAASEVFLASRAVSLTLLSHHEWIQFQCP
jgi:hypothetical protein